MTFFEDAVDQALFVKGSGGLALSGLVLHMVLVGAVRRTESTGEAVYSC